MNYLVIVLLLMVGYAILAIFSYLRDKRSGRYSALSYLLIFPLLFKEAPGGISWVVRLGIAIAIAAIVVGYILHPETR